MKIWNLGSRIVNNYLIESEKGYILIDTGYAGGYEQFKKNLAQTGVSLKEIKYLFLTHAHDDHAGFLNEVLANTEALVILHPKAIDGLRRGQNSFEGGCSNLLAWLFCQILALVGKGEHRFPPIRKEFENRLITTDSEKFRQLEFPYQILETPGHTADHISLLAGDKLFCGDAAMNGFPSIRRNIIWIENIADYRRSWQTMIASDAETVYPSHGRPFAKSDLVRYSGARIGQWKLK